MKDNKYLYFCYLLIIGVVFYVMNVFTPLFSDDWHFKFIFGTRTQVRTISDLFYSLYLHYMNYTGRFYPHFFVQLFDGILGKSLFNIANALVLVWFLHLLSSNFSTNKNARYVFLSISVFFLFMLLNGFGDTLLWMSAACNYLWCMTIFLLFNRFFFKNITTFYYYPLLFLLGLFSGWTNETFIIGMGAGFLVFIWDNRDKISRTQAILLAGFFIGAGLLVFSPASFQRLEWNNQSVTSLSANVLTYILAVLRLDNVRIFPVLLVLLMIFYFTKKEETKAIIKKNKYLIICILVTLLFVIFTKDYSHRSRVGIEFFSLFIILQLLAIIKIPRILVHLMNVGVLIVCISSFPYLQKNYSEYKNVVAQIEQGKDLILTNEVKVPPLFRRFVVYYSLTEDDSRYAGYDKNDTYNVLISYYFGEKLLAFLPERLYKEIKENPDRYNDFSSYPDLPFYIKKHDGKKIRRIYYVSEQVEEKDVPFYMRWFVRNNPQYSKARMMVKYTILPIDNESYLIIDKNEQMNDDLIKNIVIEH